VFSIHGYCPHATVSRPVAIQLDEDARVMVMLVGRPDDPTWDQNGVEAVEAMDIAQTQAVFRHSSHRRGDYPTVANGLSYGGGQKVCFPSRLLTTHLMPVTATPGIEPRPRIQ
jgi:hypothetical protein